MPASPSGLPVAEVPEMDPEKDPEGLGGTALLVVPPVAALATHGAAGAAAGVAGVVAGVGSVGGVVGAPAAALGRR